MIFSKSHPDMGKSEACLTCHPTGCGEANKFSTELHKIHKDKAKLECSACHALCCRLFRVDIYDIFVKQ